MKQLLLVALLALMAPVAEAAPMNRTIEFVYVVFGGNPASATPRTMLAHDYGEDLHAAAVARIGWVQGGWGTIGYKTPDGQNQVTATLGTVYGYVVIPLDAPAPGSNCSQSAVQSAANKLLPPLAPTATTRWYFLPTAAGVCGNSDSTFPGGFVLHEFGHMLGRGHAHDLLLNGTSTTGIEYGSRSVMGGQGENLGADMKDALGLFNSVYQIASIQQADGPRTVTLDPIDTVVPGVKALKVTTTITKTSPFGGNIPIVTVIGYYVEFRPGRQGGPNEVLIRDASNYLRDLDPTSGVRFGMRVGETQCFTTPVVACFTLNGYGTSATGPTASVSVTFDGAQPPPVPPQPVTPKYSKVLDDGDAGMTVTGPNWFHRTDEANAYGGDIYHVSPGCPAGGTGTREAWWTFTDVPAVPVQVRITWSAYSNRATNTPFDVRDAMAGTILASQVYNQQQTPTGVTVNGKVFQTLGGLVTSMTGQIVVHMSDNANGCVIADAVQVITP